MKRFHVHVAVPDLDQSVRFYWTLFAEDKVSASAEPGCCTPATAAAPSKKRTACCS